MGTKAKERKKKAESHEILWIKNWGGESTFFRKEDTWSADRKTKKKRGGGKRI